MVGENLQNFGGLPVKDFLAAGDFSRLRARIADR